MSSKLAEQMKRAWERDGVPAVRVAGRIFLGAIFGPALDVADRVVGQVREEDRRSNKTGKPKPSTSAKPDTKPEPQVIEAVFVDEDEEPSSMTKSKTQTNTKR